MNWQHRRQLAKLAAMEAERTRLFIGVPPSAPIDPVDTASKCGCDVRFLSLTSLEGVYSPEPRPTIVVGSQRPAGRRAYTCAHELGHHVFKHGASIDELRSQDSDCNQSDEEFLADAYAGFLLMSQTAVLRALKDRGLSAASLRPEQAYKLANFFGVGYGSFVSHLAVSLQLLTTGTKEVLQGIQPKQIKTQYDVDAMSEVVIVDYYWKHRAVDLEIGDTVVLPHETITEMGQQLEPVSNTNYSIFRAINPGYARAFCLERNWAVNIRISRKHYEGLAQYRFLEEVKDD